jgi:hypothetical protein
MDSQYLFAGIWAVPYFGAGEAIGEYIEKPGLATDVAAW